MQLAQLAVMFSCVFRLKLCSCIGLLLVLTKNLHCQAMSSGGEEVGVCTQTHDSDNPGEVYQEQSE